jgi:hypothetical protein
MRKTEHSVPRRRLFAPATPLLLAAALFAPPAFADDDGDETGGFGSVRCETSVTIVPISEEAANYSGKIKCRPVNPGHDKKERRRRRRLAERCADSRRLEVHHGDASGFEIGAPVADDDGRWRLVGNKPPTGDIVTVYLINEERNPSMECKQTPFDGKKVVSP